MPKVVCPNGHRLQVQDGHIGQVINCPSCQASFVAQPDPSESGFQSMGGGSYGGGRSVKKGGSGVARVFNLVIGKPFLFIGLFLVIFGRGCDAVGMRYVGRTSAYYRDAQTQFQNKWDGKLSAKRRAIDKLQKERFGPGVDAARRKEIDDQLKTLRDEQQKMNSEYQDKRDELMSGDWKDLRQAAQSAGNNHRMWIYWYEWLFIFGTMVLLIGLLTVAFTAEGGERWIAYIMITIITFSIYVGGSAWIESIASSVQSIASEPIGGGGTFPGPPGKNF